MSSRRRAILFALGSLTGVVACNGLTGIGDYSVTADASAPEDAPGPLADASAPPETSAPDAADAACVIRDNDPRDPGRCDIASASNIGADMVPLGFGYHCIDVTEVTVTQYQAFLADRGATNTCDQPAECAWNTTYAAADAADGGAPAGDTPQVNVDWCDAFMYCRWAGKNLCGGFDFSHGPPRNAPWPDAVTPTRDLWYAFCTAAPSSQDVLSDYFYGRTSVPGTCQDSVRASALAGVGSAPECHGVTGSNSAKVYDMAGNAAEWEWSCQGESCLVRGGSYRDRDVALSCAATVPVNRHTQSPTIGFRCCLQ